MRVQNENSSKERVEYSVGGSGQTVKTARPEYRTKQGKVHNWNCRMWIRTVQVSYGCAIN